MEKQNIYFSRNHVKYSRIIEHLTLMLLIRSFRNTYKHLNPAYFTPMGVKSSMKYINSWQSDCYQQTLLELHNLNVDFMFLTYQ